MFENLSDKLDRVFKKLKGRGKLSEKDIKNSLREIRRLLLEADVSYKVAKDFVNKIQRESLGKKVSESFTPGQEILKIVYKELTSLMGDSAVGMNLSGMPPSLIMLVGLQGSGKTTVAAKLANYFNSKGRNPALAAIDPRRPAAVQQLKRLGESLSVPVYPKNDGKRGVVETSQKALSEARKDGRDLLILDTAGRLHIDKEMMQELKVLREKLSPHETLLVVDAMTGQDAVNIAEEFLKIVDFDGIFLTKMDSDTRGGAALSMRAVTGKPIKFIGTGEKTEALEVFYPDRMASRILGMGDLNSLVERVQESVDEKKAKELEERIKKEAFTFDDFLEQLQKIKKMGPLNQLLEMIPGVNKTFKGVQVDENAFASIEAIINSMTKAERRNPRIINGSRRRRIARGSGTSIQEVNRLIKQFFAMQKMAKRLGKTKSVFGL